MGFVHFAILSTVLLLAGCAGEQLSLSANSAEQPAAPAGMPGRWSLAAPNAPPCGMNFGGGPQEGRISPDGGCPGRFFLSRKWSLAGDMLTISDDDGQALGTLKLSGAQYEGQAESGMPVTLSR